jgi:hypothetical protein
MHIDEISKHALQCHEAATSLYGTIRCWSKREEWIFAELYGHWPKEEERAESKRAAEKHLPEAVERAEAEYVAKQFLKLRRLRSVRKPEYRIFTRTRAHRGTVQGWDGECFANAHEAAVAMVRSLCAAITRADQLAVWLYEHDRSKVEKTPVAPTPLPPSPPVGRISLADPPTELGQQIMERREAICRNVLSLGQPPDLSAELEWEAGAAESQWDESVNDVATPPKPSEEMWIIAVGERNYQIGDSRPIKVTDREDTVLRTFIESPTMEYDELADKSGLDPAAAVRVLRGLTTKYKGLFGTAIHLPGGKGKGGYHVRISIKMLEQPEEKASVQHRA